jgi:translation elongation factor EF-4
MAGEKKTRRFGEVEFPQKTFIAALKSDRRGRAC